MKGAILACLIVCCLAVDATRVADDVNEQQHERFFFFFFFFFFVWFWCCVVWSGAKCCLTQWDERHYVCFVRLLFVIFVLCCYRFVLLVHVCVCVWKKFRRVWRGMFVFFFFPFSLDVFFCVDSRMSEVVCCGLSSECVALCFVWRIASGVPCCGRCRTLEFPTRSNTR
jgi:hypothetical protein